MLHFSTLFFLFMIYSILGWLFETVYCSLVHLSWDNRGMLNGPYCPIYGIGAILAAYICPITMHPFRIFLICAVGASVLEYVTSFLTEKFFHAVWWDYSYLPLNLNGRICFSVALGFGIAGIVVVRLLHPIVGHFINALPVTVHEFFALLFMAIFAADLALTLDALTSLNEKLSVLEESLNDSISQRYDALVNRFLASLSHPQKHIMKSFSSFQKVSYSELAKKMKDLILKRD